MKKMIYAAVTWLFAASQILSQNGTLQVRATGTGNTTGHIANLIVFNPSSEAQTFTFPASYIPSGGQYQPYVVPTGTSVSVPPGSTANLPVEGYCTDIYLPPVPSGHKMPPFSDWQTAAQNPAAANLLDAIQRLSTAFETLKEDGAVSTPFSSNPNQEREAVIQQSFWIYTAHGKYTREEFSANTIKQFESTSGQKFTDSAPEAQKSVEQGVLDFWNTFEAVGAKAKVLKAGTGTSDGPVEISVKDNYCGCGTVTLTAKVFIKDPFQPEVGCSDLNLDGGSNTRDTIEHQMLPNYEARLEITNLVTKCTECNNGECVPGDVVVTVSSKGMTENKAEQIAVAGGKYALPARTVAPLAENKKSADNPVRFYITVKYDCTKAGCKKKSCEKIFEVTLPRK